MCNAVQEDARPRGSQGFGFFSPYSSLDVHLRTEGGQTAVPTWRKNVRGEEIMNKARDVAQLVGYLPCTKPWVRFLMRQESGVIPAPRR